MSWLFVSCLLLLEFACSAFICLFSLRVCVCVWERDCATDDCTQLLKSYSFVQDYLAWEYWIHGSCPWSLAVALLCFVPVAKDIISTQPRGVLQEGNTPSVRLCVSNMCCVFDLVMFRAVAGSWLCSLGPSPCVSLCCLCFCCLSFSRFMSLIIYHVPADRYWLCCCSSLVC